MNTNKKTMWAAKIDEIGNYVYEEVPIIVNRWINTPPYATQQDVLIQDTNDKITLGCVASHVELKKDGRYQVGGIFGGKGPKELKCYMIVPFPFDDPTGWVFFGDEERAPRKGQKYLITVELVDECHKRHYFLEIRQCKPGKYSDWAGYDYKGLINQISVIAWRPLPPARQ